MSLSLSRHNAAERFYGFMVKREELRLKKASGAPYPWTDDPILRDYKFTNVKREHDRTTMELVRQFYGPNRAAPVEEILFNAGVFRYFGTHEMAAALGWQRHFRGDYMKEIARQRMARKERVFTGAYVITNQGISAPKEEVVVDHFLAALWKDRHDVTDAIKTGYWKDAITRLRTVEGFGGSGFMAKEVMLDVVLGHGFGRNGPLDRNKWCPAGPGARRGLNRLLGRDKDAPLKEDLAVECMVELFYERLMRWPSGWVELELHDIQFQLCEFDKYERVRLGEGKPRSRYRPPVVPVT